MASQKEFKIPCPVQTTFDTLNFWGILEEKQKGKWIIAAIIGAYFLAVTLAASWILFKIQTTFISSLLSLSVLETKKLFSTYFKSVYWIVAVGLTFQHLKRTGNSYTTKLNSFATVFSCSIDSSCNYALKYTHTKLLFCSLFKYSWCIFRT